MTPRFEPLAARAARLEELAAALGDMISASDRDGRYVDVSAGVTALLGYGRHELVGTEVLDLVHPQDAPRVGEAHAGVLAGDQQRISYRARRADGRYVWLETLLRPVRCGRRVVEVVGA